MSITFLFGWVTERMEGYIGCFAAFRGCEKACQRAIFAPILIDINLALMIRFEKQYILQDRRDSLMAFSEDSFWRKIFYPSNFVHALFHTASLIELNARRVRPVHRFTQDF